VPELSQNFLTQLFYFALQTACDVPESAVGVSGPTNMLTKLREILLTQYIGSILVALLAWQAALEIITTAVQAGFWFSNHRHTESVFEGSPGAPFPWETLAFSAVTVALYLATAYGLARWLYPVASPEAQAETEDESSPDQSEQV
jgi:hypothetical protein